MNYLAHGYRFLDRPYFVAGTAIPDWLNVVDRKVRARSRAARAFVHDPDSAVAEVARGVVQHHADDNWFHRTPAFAELCWKFTAQIRDMLPADDGLRPSFLGHILVELLLDAVLVEEDCSRLDSYYQVIDTIEPTLVNRALNRFATRPTDQLAVWIPRFVEARFLYDYVENAKLLFRLNGVLARVGLAPLPEVFVSLLPDARRDVRDRKQELLDQDSVSAPKHRTGGTLGD